MLRVLACLAFLSLLVSGKSAVAEECRFVGEVNGTSIAKSAAFEHVQAAALDGDTACQRLLGSMYGFGIGTPANEVAARRWKVVAALSGDAAGREDLVSTFGIRESVYDPVLVYALLSEGTEANDAPLQFWSAKLSAFELAEAKRVSTALAHLRKK